MVSKSTLDPCLSGIQYPARSEEIGECVSGNSTSCPVDVMAELRHLPLRVFASEDEILKELNEGGVRRLS